MRLCETPQCRRLHIRQEQALVQESLQYQEMTNEATSLLGAIAALKNKFSQHENASSALFEQISKLFQEPPTEPPTEREEMRQAHHDQVASEVQTSTDEVKPLPQDDGQLDIFTAIESVKATTGSRYETQQEIAEALADEEATTVDNGQLDSAIDSTSTEENAEEQWVNLVEDEPESGYESAEQISEVLADTENLDTHLMAMCGSLLVESR